MAPPNSLRDLLHLVQPPYRKKELLEMLPVGLVQELVELVSHMKQV